MAELNPKHIQAVLHLMNEGPYFKHLSMIVKEMGIGYSVVETDIGKEHLNPFGGVHGGVYASAIDTAAYWAVYCELDEALGHVTIDVKVDYLAPAPMGKMNVNGHRIRIGKTTCLAEATAFDSAGRWLAHGTSKMMVGSGLQSIRQAAEFIGVGVLPSKLL